jgi:hypothetical protein
MYQIKRGDWGFKLRYISDVVEFLRINLVIDDPWDQKFFELINEHYIGGDFSDKGAGFLMEYYAPIAAKYGLTITKE